VGIELRGEEASLARGYDTHPQPSPPP